MFFDPTVPFCMAKAVIRISASILWLVSIPLETQIELFSTRIIEIELSILIPYKSY